MTSGSCPEERVSFELPEWRARPRCQEQLFSTSSSQVHLPEGIPATSEPDVPRQDFRERQSRKTLGLSTSPTVLGGEGNPLTPGQPCLLAICVLE